jgi:cytosine deaminase
VELPSAFTDESEFIPLSRGGVAVTVLPRPIRLLRGGTLVDGRAIDVSIVGETVVSLSPAGSEPTIAADDVLDLEGFMLLTAPADPHSHLDKALSWDDIRPPMGDLGLAITSWKQFAATMSIESIANRARSQALAMLANGITAIRTHVDILDGDEPLRCVEALLQVRDELRGLMEIQVVSLAGPDIPNAQIESALDLGVDLVGGAPHLAVEPSIDLHRLLGIAFSRQVGVDLHTDESLDGSVTLQELAIAVRGWSLPVAAGHCVRLGTLEPAVRAAIIADVLASDVGIIANPITNLYLQGWDHPTSTPRGLTSVRELIDAGVRLAAGADNVRDPFNPLGRSDALETAMLLVVAGHLSMTEAYAAVSDNARSVMSLPLAGAVVGAQADFLAIRGTSLADAVANARADRLVVHAGRLVASSTVTAQVAEPSSMPMLESRFR